MAHYILPANSVNEYGFYEFEKAINVETEDIFNIDIFASCRYILYINGSYVCEGPCRGDEQTRYFDTVSHKLCSGNNLINIKVLHQTNGFTTIFKTEKPMLICRIKSDNECFETDKSWSCYSIENHSPFYPEGHNSFLHPCEKINMPLSRKALEIKEMFFMENINLDFTDDCSINIFGISLLTPMTKRPIPMIYPSDEISFTVVKSGNGFIELDAGKYTTAKVCFEIAKNTDMKILYSECYEFDNGKKLRDDTNGYLKGCYDLISTADEDFKYETYWFRAFRFIRIEAENPEKALKSIKACRYCYPLEITGKFECSSNSYNKMVTVSENTLLSCMHEIFVDCPHYEQQQYIMDSAIESAVSACLSTDMRLVRKCLEEFAVSQTKSGLLHANYPSTYTQIIPGFSLFWIFFLKDYLDYSADTEFAKKYTGVMDKILLFFEEQIEKYGYISTSKYWDYVDWVPGWDYGKVPVEEGEAITIYNLYYACALKYASYICEKTNRYGLSSEYMERYEKLKENINRLCFDEKKGLYRDGSKTASYSCHTVVWAILSEVIPKDKEKEFAAHLFNNDISKCSFSMNYYLFRALEKCGMYEKAPEVLKNWEKMLDMHCTSWCEDPHNPRSECHAWSCAPIYEFATNILGVKYSFDDVIIIKPQTLGLTFAKGIVPTRHGNVCVEWENTDNGFKISINAPKDIAKHLILPNGEEKFFTQSEMEICLYPQ